MVKDYLISMFNVEKPKRRIFLVTYKTSTSEMFWLRNHCRYSENCVRKPVQFSYHVFKKHFSLISITFVNTFTLWNKTASFTIFAPRSPLALKFTAARKWCLWIATPFFWTSLIFIISAGEIELLRRNLLWKLSSATVFATSHTKNFYLTAHCQRSCSSCTVLDEKWF